MVLFPDEFKISKSLRPSSAATVRFVLLKAPFAAVITLCRRPRTLHSGHIVALTFHQAAPPAFSQIGLHIR
jgi:Leu/Phe-tRNA-protein transferase